MDLGGEEAEDCKGLFEAGKKKAPQGRSKNTPGHRALGKFLRKKANHGKTTSTRTWAGPSKSVEELRGPGNGAPSINTAGLWRQPKE